MRFDMRNHLYRVYYGLVRATLDGPDGVRREPHRDHRPHLAALVAGLLLRPVGKAPMRLISGAVEGSGMGRQHAGTLLFAYQSASRGSRESISALETKVPAC